MNNKFAAFNPVIVSLNPVIVTITQELVRHVVLNSAEAVGFVISTFNLLSEVSMLIFPAASSAYIQKYLLLFVSSVKVISPIYAVVHVQSQSHVLITNLYLVVLASHRFAIIVSRSTGQVSTVSMKEIVGEVISYVIENCDATIFPFPTRSVH